MRGRAVGEEGRLGVKIAFIKKQYPRSWERRESDNFIAS
jgi:hypothetical protein